MKYHIDLNNIFGFSINSGMKKKKRKKLIISLVLIGKNHVCNELFSIFFRNFQQSGIFYDLPRQRRGK